MLESGGDAGNVFNESFLKKLYSKCNKLFGVDIVLKKLALLSHQYDDKLEKKLQSIIIIYYYYYHYFSSTSLKSRSLKGTNYIIKINIKKPQIKFTVTDIKNKTIFTSTCGTLLIYSQILKKSLKKSLKAYLIFFTFMGKFIKKILKNQSYFLEVVGSYKKLHKIKSLLDKTFSDDGRLSGLIFLPKYAFFTNHRKKIKSIKRKLLRKNLSFFLDELKIINLNKIN